MTKEQKIEEAAREYATHGNSHDLYIAGAKFGYELAVEEFIKMINECEGDIDFLKFKIRKAKNETNS